jgi:hypothetical protein
LVIIAQLVLVVSPNSAGTFVTRLLQMLFHRHAIYFLKSYFSGCTNISVPFVP